ncbi:UTP3 small subunit processome component Sas10 [Leptinotarsa decemlineata]|uniref:UTP3 small subunit processome component Sas10 n=1 Tax=Leptinotarsa decemlineata TaxID=7539 RepID=UPI003D308032
MTSRERSLDEDFSGSDSDEEYDENERQLLSNFRNSGVQEYSDDENEVLGVGSDETDSDDNKSDLALSDVEGQDEDDDLPDIRAWGKDKKKFYKTDYVDADYGGFQGKDAHLAELEEEEARNIQKQLAQQLDDDDFGVELFAKKSEEDAKPGEEVVKTDLSKLSKRQKLQILEKESPEFFSLVEDFQGKIVIARDFLRPVLQKYKKGKIPNCEAVDFVQTQYELILNYCTNIYMYLLLKSTKASNIQNHPVIKRLFQYRQLLLQLEPVFEEIIKPQIELLLKEEELTNNNPEKKKKTLKLLSSLKNKTEKAKKNKKQVSIDEPPSKKMKVDENISEDKEAALKDMEPGNIADSSEDDAEKVDEENPEETEETNEVGKRAITYKMSKNKGLTPHRKKEQRNPRVKHKLKYRKAVIQRKGAVREPRKELHRYSGEISGIKASVSRSIKIKT